MLNKVKKVVALGLIGLALLSVPAKVHAVAKAPKHSGGIVFPDPSFIGIKAARLMNTATVTALVAGTSVSVGNPGLLYAICATGGTIGKYAVAYDYYAASSISLTAALYDGGNPSKYLISPLVFTNTGTYVAGTPDGPQSCWVPPFPVRFELGLVGANNDAGHRTLFYYRLDDGSNP